MDNLFANLTNTPTPKFNIQGDLCTPSKTDSFFYKYVPDLSNWIYSPASTCKLEKNRSNVSEIEILTWTIKAFQLLTPQFMPQFLDGQFATLSFFFELLENVFKNSVKDTHKNIQHTFFTQLSDRLPLNQNSLFPAEVYCFAKQIVLKALEQRPENDAWKLFNSPSESLKSTAQNLISSCDELLKSIRKQNQESINHSLVFFQQNWKSFLETMVFDKNDSTTEWIGSFSLERTIKDFFDTESNIKYLKLINSLKSLNIELSERFKNGKNKSLIHHMHYHIFQNLPLTPSQDLFKKALRNWAHQGEGYLNLSQFYKFEPQIFKELLFILAFLNIQENASLPSVFDMESTRLCKINQQVYKLIKKDSKRSLSLVRESVIHHFISTIPCQDEALLSSLKKKKIIDTLKNIFENLHKTREMEEMCDWYGKNLHSITLIVDIKMWLATEKLIELSTTPPFVT
jgi:hypothetical protein